MSDVDEPLFTQDALDDEAPKDVRDGSASNEHKKAAIEAYNARVGSEGLPLAMYRSF